jgi:two-component system chemotaxis sensor kinase CheA
LVVPVSLSSVEALLVEAAGAVCAIPLSAVRGGVRLAAGDMARTADGASIAYDNKVVAFAPLSSSLKGHGPTRLAGAHSALLVEGSAMLAAIGVDRLLGASEIVVRPLPAGAVADPMIAGVSLDAEGVPFLVLDPQGLVAATLRTGGLSQDAATVRSAPILVIDDSLTTRVLEQSILESAGYEVELATSAEEALEKVKHRRYALFLVDVEMPGMDGFSFVQKTRADPDLRAIPAILVTSRNSPEDQQRGIDVGACGYVVKGEFDQVRVLETIRELLERS